MASMNLGMFGKEDVSIQKKNSKELDKALYQLKETFPSFIRYCYDWVWTASSLSPNGMGGFVKPSEDKKSMEVVAFDSMFKQGTNKLKGFIVHEMLHVYNDHFTRQEKGIKDVTILIKDIEVKDKDGKVINTGMSYYPSLWNVATDLAINYTIEHYLDQYKVELPDNGLRVELFPSKIQQDITDKDAETIFYVLKKAYEEDSKKFQEMMKKMVQQIVQSQQNQSGQGQGQSGQGQTCQKCGQPMNGQGQPQQGQQGNQQNPGQQGQGSGQQSQGQGQPQQGQGQQSGQGSGGQPDPNAPQQNGQSSGNGQKCPHCGHEQQGQNIKVNVNFDDHSELQKMAEGEHNKDISDKVKNDSREDEMMAGKEGGGWSNIQASDPLDRIIKNMIVKQKGKVDLRKILKDIRGEIVSKSSSLQPVVDYSYKRVNRKKWSVANKYGVAFKGKAKFYKQKELIIALDTSGSVGENDIDMALRVVNAFLKDHHFSVHFIQCDSNVHNDTFIHKPMKDTKIYGRGGTNYQPVFNHIKKNYIQKGKNIKNILLCYIGDGQTGYDLDDFGINTIWIFTQNFDQSFYNNVKFGRKYKIPDLMNVKYV